MYKVSAYVDRSKLKKKLSWADFKGQADDQSMFYAFTYWNVEYSYAAPGDDQSEIVVNIANKVLPDSWVRPQAKTRELLRHEKGHFNIAKILALRLREQLNGCKLNSNFVEVIEAIFNKLHQEALQVEKKYDSETHHYKNKDAQSIWDYYLNTQLISLMSKL